MTSCLLIIDVQTGLFAETPNPADADVIIERINQLADRARLRGIPVILIQYEEPTPELEYNSAGWQFDSRLRVHAGDLRVRKKTVDSFHESTLQAMLAERGINHVVICGYATEFCIDSTTRRAAALGYNVTLVSDAHTTQDKPYLSAEITRLHHNRTLVNVTGFAGRIETQAAAALWL